MPIIQVRDFSFAYPNQAQRALQGVNLQIDEGSFTLLCGRSGSGKTTLLRHLKRELAPHGRAQGEIYIGGKAREALAPKESASLVGFVMQQPENQLVTDTVWHELAFGLENLSLPTQVIRRRVAETAHFFGIAPWFSRRVESLSGGQKQVLNLASVMAMQPRVLVLDEPTAQLDPIAAKNFLQALERVNSELGVTVVISEHRLEDVLPLADQVAYLADGKLAFAGAPRDFVAHIAAHPQARFAQALPEAARLALALQAPPPYPISVREGRNMVAARAPGSPAPKQAAPTPKGEVLLSARGVWYAYPEAEQPALRGLDIALRRGALHMLLGGNASGKSTALLALCGLCKPQRGSVTRARGARVALLMQNPQALFAADTLEADLMAQAGQGGYTHADMQAWAQRLGVAHLLERHPYDLSGGEMQKAALCKVLLMRPDVLLLDEPTKGVDAFAREQIALLLEQLARQGRAVAVVTHDVELAARHGDTCAMMFAGELLASDAGREFFLGNNFYTTAVNRMTRGLIDGCVTLEDVLQRVQSV
nr:ABC transporter ATP-binding protein [Maliibacterium massiliense]